MTEDVPDRMPDRMPEDMPEDMSDRMPEDLPVTKRIDVMVGITRSKVISIFFFWFSNCPLLRSSDFITGWLEVGMLLYMVPVARRPNFFEER